MQVRGRPVKDVCAPKPAFYSKSNHPAARLSADLADLWNLLFSALHADAEAEETDETNAGRTAERERDSNDGRHRRNHSFHQHR